MRSSFLALTALSLPQHVSADCSSPLVNTVLALFNVSSVDDLPNALLSPIQAKCAAGNCPTVPTSCGNQSVDDIQCEIPVFDQPVSIGTDLVCNTACDDWPCKVSCQGINVAICDTAEFAMCKVGCLGIHKCIHACEEVIVEPCRQLLINDCTNACEATFDVCTDACDSVLTMQVTGYLEKLENIVSSLSIPSFDLDCHGNGVSSPFVFNASLVGAIGDLDLSIKIHTKDCGIGTTNTINLNHLTAALALPVAGSIQCGLRKSQQDIDITFGDAVISDFNVDVEELNTAVSTISAVICLDLPFCKNAIQDGIDSAIKLLIVKFVPNAVASMISPTLQSLVTGLACPNVALDEEKSMMINV